LKKQAWVDTNEQCQIKRSDVDEVPLVREEISALVEGPEMCMPIEHGA